MIIGVPKEIKEEEYRVAITPAGVRMFRGHGHEVIIEKNAGAGSFSGECHAHGLGDFPQLETGLVHDGLKGGFQIFL